MQETVGRVDDVFGHIVGVDADGTHILGTVPWTDMRKHIRAARKRGSIGYGSSASSGQVSRGSGTSGSSSRIQGTDSLGNRKHDPVTPERKKELGALTEIVSPSAPQDESKSPKIVQPVAEHEDAYIKNDNDVDRVTEKLASSGVT